MEDVLKTSSGVPTMPFVTLRVLQYNHTHLCNWALYRHTGRWMVHTYAKEHRGYR